MGLFASAGWLAVVLLQPSGSAVGPLAAYAAIAAGVMVWRGWRLLAPMLRVSLSGVVWGLGVGALMTALTYALYPLARAALPTIADDVQGLYRQLDLGSLAAALPLVCVVVAGEELVWRGTLLEAVATARAWNRRRFAQIAFVSAVYAVAQAGFGSLLLVVVAFGCGLVWSALRLQTKQLVAPLASHLVWSSFVLWLVPLEG